MSRCALTLVLGAPFVIEVIAGPDFDPAAAVLRIQAVTLLVVFLVVTLNYALLSLRAHRTMLVITGGALAINAVGVGLLGAAHGATGAAVGTMVADVIGLIATGWALSRLGLPVGGWLAAVPRVAVAALPGAALWFAPIPDVAKAAIGAVAYGVMLLILRAVPEELLVEVRRLRQSRT
jgi:O-antigen/teichoic acid export membrane protein